MNEYQGDKVLFNCTAFAGSTILQGSNGFFSLLCDILDTVLPDMNEQTDNKNYTVEEILSGITFDLKELVMIKSADGSPIVECFDAWGPEKSAQAIRFHGCLQLNLSSKIAFALGEKINGGLQNMKNLDREVFNAMFAFSRVIQHCAAGIRPNRNQR